jgi:hypothetical protein
MNEKAFYVQKRGNWWVVAPIVNSTTPYKLEKALGVEEIAYYAYRDRHEALDKMFELIDVMDKE